MKRIICIVSVILFLVFIPGVIANRVHEDVYTIENREKAQRFKGSLTIWHVVTFKTGAMSGVGFLRERADKFEQSNAHLFIDVIGMTAQEAEERLKNGEIPDIVSYPLGFFTTGDEFLQLEQPENLLESFKNVGSYGEKIVALPYMADSYALISNETIMGELGIRLANEPTIEEFFEVLSRIKENGISGIALSDTGNSARALGLLRYETEGEGIKTFGEFGVVADGAESFLQGESGFYIAPFAEYEKLLESESAMSIEAIGISDYTDLVQMISITATADDAKAQMCSEFVQNLFRDGVQGELSGMKMIRVTNSNEVSGGEAERIGEFGVIPNSFDAGANWEEQKKSAYESIASEGQTINIKE